MKELKLIQAYQKYIHFLGKAYDDMFAVANAHGYNCTEQEIEFGQQLRNAIKELEEECGVDPNLYEKYIVDGSKVKHQPQNLRTAKRKYGDKQSI